MDLKSGESRSPPKMKFFQDPPPPSVMQRRASISGERSSGPLSSISENIQTKRPMQRSQSFIQNGNTKGMQSIGLSPTKKRNINPLLPYTSVFQGQLDTIKMPPPETKRGASNGSPQKKPSLSRFDTSLPKARQSQKQETLMPKYNAMAAFHPSDKENYIPNLSNSSNSSSRPISRASSGSLLDVEKKLLNALSSKDSNPIPTPTTDQASQVKPPLQEAAPIKEKSSKKGDFREGCGGSEVTIPLPEEMPPIVDDGDKPSYSYATLIGMAILRAPNRRLTLSQIYKWISETFSYYRTSDHGWQNSIRHNLSLNKALIRVERPKDEPGKGSYWTIKEGQEYQFITGKGANKRASAAKKGAEKPTKKTKDMKGSKEEAIKETKKVEVPCTPLPSVLNTDSTEILDDSLLQISSDATRTATPSPRNSFSMESNSFLENYSTGLMAAPSIQPSSPPQDFRSSPPVARQFDSIPLQTPPSTYYPSSIRKRKYSMNDSGYLSSFDSSSYRGGEIGGRRIKRGRAEEDIARIRRRSTISESPLFKLTLAQNNFQSSSPMRQYTSSSYLQQLTPATTLRVPKQAQVPLSASPNTNLKMFRNSIHEMVGSPATNVETVSEESLDLLFDTFIDRSPESTSTSTDINSIKSPMKSPCPPSRISFNGSPLKRSANRRFPPIDSSKFLDVPSDPSQFETTFGDEFLNADAFCADS
ncbi:hypothetical protein BJ508DRAFT_98244 [Ascobolus immersus RN42]|uniref:Fork-head domain-containing protein n=1 Tax=Ascobolus immersus RN42 TaxID=1160509 RepID=A0A3N4IME2_ASCIM|nr:hypothetical protein BJ508DRAFT_98244 [Ascobolus immersus RN42]